MKGVIDITQKRTDPNTYVVTQESIYLVPILGSAFTIISHLFSEKSRFLRCSFKHTLEGNFSQLMAREQATVEFDMKLEIGSDDIMAESSALKAMLIDQSSPVPTKDLGTTDKSIGNDLIF